ncbi:peroxiredoxin-like 2A isoform X1 [Lates japonicus]|uniref:Peroxiredoxin-like 2A n=1 Tax=Lates japonicus TaxID=270547 RepID=A0AAD3R8X4_LATJO|nr:peroxiredoxin-like 2A isoform X1 [Lates japonicus]
MEAALPSVLRGELFSLWYVALVAVAALVVAVVLANTDFFLIKSAPASLDELASAELQTTTGDGKTVKALCREEAAELSSLKPQLDELGVPLYAVVKEDVGTEVQNFRPYFKGEIFVDHKVFYGPKPRRMGVGLGLVRLGVLRNLIQIQRRGYQGNREGEGFILGGLYVTGAGKQGILLEHKEKEFGDKADLSSVLEAAKKINKSQ